MPTVVPSTVVLFHFNSFIIHRSSVFKTRLHAESFLQITDQHILIVLNDQIWTGKWNW